MHFPLRFLCGAGLMGLAGCAMVPDRISGPVSSTNPAYGATPSGQRVRWGGTLLATRPLADHTCFEILSRPLSQSGRPIQAEPDLPQQRFLACQAGFVDPEAHPKGTLVTVLGQVQGTENKKVGDYILNEPRVGIAGVQWWRPHSPVGPVYGPYGPYAPYGFWGDPFGYGYGPAYGGGIYGGQFYGYGRYGGYGGGHYGGGGFHGEGGRGH